MGRQDKKIYVETDAPQTPRITLSLNLTVPALAEFRPKMLLWQKGGKLDAKKLHIDTAREYGARIAKAECKDKNFKIDFIPQKENTDFCEISIRPLSLDAASKSELLLECVAKGEFAKTYKVHLLIR